MSQKKQIFKLNILKKLLDEENSCVSLVPTTRLLALPPYFLNDLKSGIFYLLNSILKKYDRTLNGIVIGYQNVKLLMDDNTGIIPMGAAETEVNVSVEFYIFQPKIGNYLEGIVNKKSNNHIGCLVHHYFNATILKPEDVEYKDWICRDFNVNDKITFRVMDLDFTGLLPYIEGTVSEDAFDGIKSVRNDNKVEFGDVNSKEDCSVELKTLDKTKEGKKTTLDFNVTDGILSENDLDKEHKKKKKKKKKKKEKDKVLLGDVEEEVGNVKSSNETEIKFTSVDKESKDNSCDEKKKKKKKKEKDKVSLEEVESKAVTAKRPNETEIESNGVDKESKDNSHREKGKRKEEKERVVETQVKMSEEVKDSSAVPNRILEKIGIWDDEVDSKDFVKSPKEKKKRKRKEEEETVSRTKETEKPSLKDEDNIFFSTQLEPGSGSSKMRMSFLSPIPAEKPAEKEESKDLFNSLMNSIHEELNGKPKKRPKDSDKKRKKSGVSEDWGTLKEVIKSTSSAKTPKVEVNGELRKKSKVQKRPSEESATDSTSIYEKLMSEAMSAISSGERKKRKKEKGEREAGKKRKRKDSAREGSPPAKKFRNGSMYDLNRTPEKRDPDKSLFTDSDKSVSAGKRKTIVNGATPEKSPKEEDKLKSLVQGMLQDFLENESGRFKNESDRESGRESGKESKRKQQQRKEEKIDSLCARLLKEAKMSINFRSPQERKAAGSPTKEGNSHVKALF